MTNDSQIINKIFADAQGVETVFTEDELELMRLNPDSTNHYYAIAYAKLAKNSYRKDPNSEDIQHLWEQCCEHMDLMINGQKKRQTAQMILEDNPVVFPTHIKKYLINIVGGDDISVGGRF